MIINKKGGVMILSIAGMFVMVVCVVVVTKTKSITTRTVATLIAILAESVVLNCYR
jgi:hypothetical protein